VPTSKPFRVHACRSVRIFIIVNVTRSVLFRNAPGPAFLARHFPSPPPPPPLPAARNHMQFELFFLPLGPCASLSPILYLPRPGVSTRATSIRDGSRTTVYSGCFCRGRPLVPELSSLLEDAWCWSLVRNFSSLFASSYGFCPFRV